MACYGEEGNPIVIWTDEKYYNIAQKIIQGYKDDYCDFEFKLEKFNSQELYEKIIYYISIKENQQLPNMILIHDSELRKYFKKFPNLFKQLGDYISTSDFWASKQANITFDDGNIYAIPISSEPVALYYNYDALDGFLDLSENISMEDFIYFCNDLKSHFSSFKLQPAKDLIPILQQATGRLYYDENGVATIDGLHDILEFVSRLIYDELLLPDEILDEENYEELIEQKIINEELLIAIGGPEWFTRIKKTEEKKESPHEWRIATLPKSSHFEYDVDLGGCSLMVLDKPYCEQDYISYLLYELTNFNDDFANNLTRTLAKQCDNIPSNIYAKSMLDDLENNGCFWEMEVIKFFYNLLEFIPEIRHGNFTQQITNDISKISKEIAVQNNNVSDGCAELAQKVAYYNQSDDAPLIADWELDHIEIEEPPTRTSYYKYERFDTTGMVVRAYFSDGNSIITDKYSVNPMYLVLGNNYVEISVTCGGKTRYAYQEITVNNRVLVSISVETAKPIYDGEPITPSNFRVEAHYNHGEGRAVSNNLTISPDKIEDICFHDVTISYTEDGYQAPSQTIKVYVYKTLSHLEIVTQPNKLVYNNGAKLDRTGLSVLAHYNHGDPSYIPTRELKITPEYIKFEDGKDTTTVMLSYTEGQKTRSTGLSVYRSTGADLENCDIKQDMGSAGMGTVNLFNGKFKYTFNDFIGNDANCPISVSHIYSTDFNENSCFGKHWRLNVEQELEKIDGKWQYMDKDGKKHEFDSSYEKSNGRSSVRHESLGLDLFENGDKIKLIDRSNNTLEFTKFSSTYKLTAMHIFPSTPETTIDAYSMQITYNENGINITSITAGKKIDGYRPTLVFNYFNGYLQNLQYGLQTLTTVAKYLYSDGNLIKFAIENENIKEEINENTFLNFMRETQFEYGDYDITFSVSDMSSKNKNGVPKQLCYNLNTSTKYVESISIGYDTGEQETTTLEYKGNRNISQDNSEDNSSPTEQEDNSSQSEQEYNSEETAATIIKSNKTVSVVTFNKVCVVSQYSYELDENGNLDKPLKVNSAQAYGYSYMALASIYSDTLDSCHNDFATGINGWQDPDSYLETNNDKYINDQKSLCGNKLSKTFDYKFNSSTDYLSFWLYTDDYKTTVSVKIKDDNDTNSFTINHSVKNGITGMWQYVSICLSKITWGKKMTVNITTPSDTNNVYICDVRIARLPYEIPSNIPNTTYNNFGNVSATYKYNPIDGITEKTTYEYNINQQLIEKEVCGGGIFKSKVINDYNENGLLQWTRCEGQSGSIISIENYGYDSDQVLNSITDANRVVTKQTCGEDFTEVSVIGEEFSPTTNQKETYYKNSGVIKYITSGDLQNEFSYNANGNLAKVQFGYDDKTHNYNSTIQLSYDSFGNLNKTTLGNTDLICADYDYKHLNKITYANGDSVSYVYDGKDRIISVSLNDTQTAQVSYNTSGNNSVEIINKNCDLTYLTKSLNKDGYISEYSAVFKNIQTKLTVKLLSYGIVDSTNVESTIIEHFVDESQTPFEKCFYRKNENGQLDRIRRVQNTPFVDGVTTSIRNGYKYNYSYMLSQKTTAYNQGAAEPSENTYEAFSIDFTYSYSRIKTETHKYSDALISMYDYDYYNNGNLKYITLNGSDKPELEYKYDEYGRLIKETNKQLGFIYTFKYDKNGNITEKISQDITSGNSSSTTFAYNNANWHDQLSSCNNTAIVYDNSGNPTDYLGKAMTWQGKNLTNVDGVDMAYDYNGLRVKKGNKMYFWYGNQLVMECWKDENTEKRIYYYYDERGVCGMNLDNYNYHFMKNVFGDILGVYDHCGNCLCKYVYDAWGNHKTFTYEEKKWVDISDKKYYNAEDSLVKKIAILNPFRYRGYYFDIETGLYYLQNRYYDPQLGRFISADISSINPQSIFGFNLYAYCSCNPVMCKTSSNLSFGNAIPTLPNGQYNGELSGKLATNNMWSNGNKINLISNSKKDNYVSMLHFSIPLLNLGHSANFGGLSYTCTVQFGNPDIFYSFLNEGDESASVGVGFNLGNWFGINTYFTTNFGSGFNAQITPWLTFGSETSFKGGLKYSIGLIIDNTTHEISLNASWLKLLAIGIGTALAFAPGTQPIGIGVLAFCFVI